MIVKIGHNHLYFEYFLPSSLLPRLAFVLPLIALVKFSTICWSKHSMNFEKTIKWSSPPYSFALNLHSFNLWPDFSCSLLQFLSCWLILIFSTKSSPALGLADGLSPAPAHCSSQPFSKFSAAVPLVFRIHVRFNQI